VATQLLVAVSGKDHFRDVFRKADKSQGGRPWQSQQQLAFFRSGAGSTSDLV